jgi:hypothetical protein
MPLPSEIVVPEVEALLVALTNRGYRITEERYEPDAFGNALVTLGRDATLIRVVRDRRQWFAEASADGWGDWFSPVVWNAMLRSSLPSIEVKPLEQQTAMLLDDIEQIEDASGQDGETLELLRIWRSRRAEARRNLAP